MDVFIGFIASFGFNFAPRNWSMCQGQLFNISDNGALFALVQTFYGGDGRVTGGIPEMRGRAPIGYGNAPGLGAYYMGQKSGYPTNLVRTENMPAHTHIAEVAAGSGGTTASSLLASQEGADHGQPQTGDYLAAIKISRNEYTNSYVSAAAKGNTVELGGLTVTGGSAVPTVVNHETGSGQPMSIMQPYQTVNYCMALQGIFPSRN